MPASPSKTGGPSTTSFFGGSQGSGVPWPRNAKPPKGTPHVQRDSCGHQQPVRHHQGPKTRNEDGENQGSKDRGHLKRSTRYSRLRSRRPSGRITSMRRAFVSMFVQISTASGINISPSEVSTSRSGVPEIPSPGNCTSRTIPSKDGASERKHGEEAKTGGFAGVSNTEHPMRSETKYCPAARVTRCSNGSSTSKPRNFSASEIESTPSK